MGVVERWNAERVRRGDELKRETISWLTGTHKIEIGLVAANEVSRILVEFLWNWRAERDSEPKLAIATVFVDETVSKLRNMAELSSAPRSGPTADLISALERFPCPDDPSIADSGRPEWIPAEVGAVPGADGQRRFDQASPDLLHFAVEVGKYVGAAALGGVIGNRADASVLVAVRGIFGSVVSRWRSRRESATDLALTEDEARDAAHAAVLAQGWPDPDSISVVGATSWGDRSWRVVVHHRSEELYVHVAAGDPAHARILVVR